MMLTITVKNLRIQEFNNKKKHGAGGLQPSLLIIIIRLSLTV